MPVSGAERQRKYSRTERGLATHRAAQAEQRRKYPERIAARNAVTHALEASHLIRGVCHCGSSTVEAHHLFGYAKEHRLNIIWLCHLHHQEAHRA